MVWGLILPACGLAVLAVLVTRVLERIVPETLPGLGLLFALASGAMWGLSALGFWALYAAQGPEVTAALGALPGAGWRHFAALGLRAGLIWGPLVALVVMTAPRRWRHATW